MKVLNFGSLNIDHVYRVPHILRPGETLASISFENFAGGKGANQSAALARAGLDVAHAGKVGRDGTWLLDKLRSFGVDTQLTLVGDGPTGHAIIQVDDAGQNAIVTFAGANKQITQAEIDAALAHAAPGTILLLQNEINDIPCIMKAGEAHEMRICFNPAPFDEGVLEYPMHLVDILILNETEAAGFCPRKKLGDMLHGLAEMFPRTEIIMTLGEDGAVYRRSGEEVRVPAHRVNAVDTTAAGDTFIGYFLAAKLEGKPVRDCLELACKAAAICVSKKGAMDSIPGRGEVV